MKNLVLHDRFITDVSEKLLKHQTYSLEIRIIFILFFSISAKYCSFKLITFNTRLSFSIIEQNLPPDLQHRQNITNFSSPPWQQGSSHVGRIYTSVPGITGRADDNSIKRQCSLSTIASYQADYVIYTNGSASGGTKNSGAAAVVTRGFPLQPDVVTTIKTKGQTFTCSYEEEAAAMESALSWTLTNANHHLITVLFCTDSKSLCEALI